MSQKRDMTPSRTLTDAEQSSLCDYCSYVFGERGPCASCRFTGVSQEEIDRVLQEVQGHVDSVAS